MDNLTLTRLRTLIGRSLVYNGRDCVVMDVLEDGPQLVLRVRDGLVIQADQWGDAHRRTPESFSVDVYNRDGQQLNPGLVALFSSSQ